MSLNILKSIEDLDEESDQYLKRYSALASRSPNDPVCTAFVEELRRWLVDCLALGRFLGSGSPERRSLRALVEEWDSRLQRDGHHLHGIDQLAPYDPAAGVVLDAECPYPGLDAYRADRAASFFGRGDLVKRYVERLVANRIFLILGASGSGKSSLALAGIRPRLQELHSDWIYPADFTPGSAPMEALVTVVAAKVDRASEAEALAGRLRADPGSAPSEFARLCGGRPLMLLIDQFEELITLCRETAEQSACAQVLLALSDSRTATDGWACYTLITLRTDHLARFENSNALKPLYVRLVDNRNSELLTTLTFDDIKRAIAEPAKVCGLRFSPSSIVDSLASQTAGLANGLPLLQFALRQLWDTRPKDPDGKPLDLITQAMVDDLPDVQRSLGKVAEGIYVGFNARQKEICGRALQELVLLDENFEEPLRRRRNRAELLSVLASRFPGPKEDISEVEQRFIAAGLLRTFGHGDDEQIEVAHEALLRHWERLNRAVSGEEAKRRLHAVKQIGREAMDWTAHGRRDDFLKQLGDPLKAARRYVDDGWLVDAESTAYVKACEDRDKFITEVVRTRKYVRWIGAVAVLGLLLVVFGFYLARVQRDAGLSTIASLAERLVPWEGLDVAYNVAKSGGAGYRFALAHALERMDDSWMLGDRDAPLFPAGDGSALLQFHKSDGKETLRVYLIGADGTPSEAPVVVDLEGTSERFAQVQVGPEIKEGMGKGQRLLVLASRPQAGTRNYSIDAYLLDPKTRRSTRLDVDGDPDPLPRADEMSSIRIHPDGNRAVWSAIDYAALKSRIQELSVDAKGVARIRSLQDPIPDPKSNFDGSPNPVTAVGYSANAVEPITGRLDGSVYCGDRQRLVDPRTPADRSPIGNIVTRGAGDVFAAANRTGQVLLGSCTGDVHALQLLSSDPGSLRLTQLRQKSASPWVVSFLDTDRQLRCYEFDPTSLKERWWICNAAHLIGSVIVITEDGQQVVVERPGVAAVRRYANEELSRSDKQVNARQAADATLRWASRTVSANAQLDAGTTPPWLFKSGDIEAKDRRKIESAALSPNGTRIVWIERLRTADHRDVVPGIENVERQPTVALIGSMVRGKEEADPGITPQSGFATAVAIDDAGNIAHVQQPPGKTILTLSSNMRELALDSYGPVQCIAYSPNGRYVVVGTFGGVLLRLPTDSNGEPTPLSRGTKGENAPPTSCAVADDGAVVAGYYDGQVLFFAKDVLTLTTRAVYAFPVPVKDVRVEPPGSQRRVTALGEWQINNCVHPGLPGQSVRAWDVNLPEARRGTPVAVACFPNATIAALGAWGEKADDDTGECPKGDKTGAAKSPARPGLCLITAHRSRWHACPACSTPGQTPEDVLTSALGSAEGKGVKPLKDSELERRYGFKLDFLP